MIWLLAGLAVALLGGLTLRWTTARLRPGVPFAGVALVAGGALLRWGLTAGLLVAALGYGVEGMLAAFLGVWVGRWIVVLWLARTDQELSS